MTLPEEKFLDEATGKWLTKSQIRRRRSLEEIWREKYDELKQYHELHGHCNVLRSDPNRALSSWVHTQRNRSKDGLLLPYQRKLLEDLGFTFVLGKGFHHARHEASEVFNLRMRQLEEYSRSANGSIRIPKIYAPNQPLAWWYHQLRPRRRRGLLSPDEINRLDAIGFEWETEKSLKAERLRAEREASESNRRENEAIRIRKQQIQQLLAAKKSSLAGAVLPLKRPPPISNSASLPRSSPSGSNRRERSESPSDTETEGGGDDDTDQEEEEEEEEEGSGSGKDEGPVAAAAEVVVHCSRVDYDSDASDDKLVVASIVWDSSQPAQGRC